MSNISCEHNGILKSAMMLSIVSAFGLIFSFIKEAVIAGYFGTSASTDAYTIAIQIPVILFAVVSTAIQTVIVPLYSKALYSEGRKGADDFASNFTTIVTVITITAVIICEIFTDQIVYLFSPGLNHEIHDLAVQLSRIVLPTMIMTELITINAGIMQVHGSYVLPALSINILNTVFIFVVVFCAKKFGIYASASGVFLGTFLQVLYSVIVRRKYFKYKFCLNIKDKRIEKAGKMAIPVFLGIGAAEINKVVDKIVSSFLVTGSISSLNYASKLTSAMSSLLITNIATVVYPKYSKYATKNDEKALADVFKMTLSLYVLILIPINFGGTFLSREIIALVFKRGAFDENSVKTVAPLFACYLICLIFTAIRQSASRVFYSLGDSKTPMKNSVIGIGINIILNVILAYYFDALGLAIATTISTAVISGLILKQLSKRLPKISYREVICVCIKCIIASTCMNYVLLSAKGVLIQLIKNIPGEFMQTLIYLGISVILGSCIYIIALILLKTKEVSAIKKLLKWRK